MGEQSNESSIDHDYVMAEYEDRFQEIDSKLDAMRASFHNNKNTKATTMPSKLEIPTCRIASLATLSS